MMNVAVLCVLLIVGSTTQAFAYIDPGTGSTVAAAVIGAVAAIGYTFRKYYYKLKTMIGVGKGGRDAERDIGPGR